MLVSFATDVTRDRHDRARAAPAPVLDATRRAGETTTRRFQSEIAEMEWNGGNGATAAAAGASFKLANERGRQVWLFPKICMKMGSFVSKQEPELSCIYEVRTEGGGWGCRVIQGQLLSSTIQEIVPE